MGNFHPREVVDRGSETQRPVNENNFNVAFSGLMDEIKFDGRWKNLAIIDDAVLYSLYLIFYEKLFLVWQQNYGWCWRGRGQSWGYIICILHRWVRRDGLISAKFTTSNHIAFSMFSRGHDVGDVPRTNIFLKHIGESVRWADLTIRLLQSVRRWRMVQNES